MRIQGDINLPKRYLRLIPTVVTDSITDTDRHVLQGMSRADGQDYPTLG